MRGQADISESLCCGLSLIFFFESDVLLLDSYHPGHCNFLPEIYNLVKWKFMHFCSAQLMALVIICQLLIGAYKFGTF